MTGYSVTSAWVNDQISSTKNIFSDVFVFLISGNPPHQPYSRENGNPFYFFFKRNNDAGKIGVPH